MIEILEILEVKSAFLSAAYGKFHPDLLRYTVDIAGRVIKAQIVVRESIDEDGLETLFEILGDTVGHLQGATAGFELVKIHNTSDLQNFSSLPIRLYLAYELR